MDVIIIGVGMPFGPETLKHKSLGGSETAQLMVGRMLAKQGHNVAQVTDLPALGEADHVVNGAVGADGVRYLAIDDWRNIITNTPCDLLVFSREPRFAESGHKAKFATFWTHDVAEPGFLPRVLSVVGHHINEIWPVSRWQATQIHQVTKYPLERMYICRNGIVDVRDRDVVGDAIAAPKRERSALLYAARPERGLEALLRPGGIMERLPDFNLEVCGYDHVLPGQEPLYQRLAARAQVLPNVRSLGALRTAQVRAAIAKASAYVYPTWFQETSCILARECIEQRTPFLTAKIGALPETLGACGLYYEDDHGRAEEWNSDRFCAAFADMVRNFIASDAERTRVVAAMTARTDLYWDEVAASWIERTRAHIARSGAVS